jgi:hypothetical protein
MCIEAIEWRICEREYFRTYNGLRYHEQIVTISKGASTENGWTGVSKGKTAKGGASLHRSQRGAWEITPATDSIPSAGWQDTLAASPPSPLLVLLSLREASLECKWPRMHELNSRPGTAP